MYNLRRFVSQTRCFCYDDIGLKLSERRPISFSFSSSLFFPYFCFYRVFKTKKVRLHWPRGKRSHTTRRKKKGILRGGCQNSVFYPIFLDMLRCTVEARRYAIYNLRGSYYVLGKSQKSKKIRIEKPDVRFRM